MKLCNVALIGISGFGSSHLIVTKSMQERGLVCIKAICETNYEGNKEEIEQLKLNGVNYYKDYIEMLENEKDIDYVVVSTPIHLHREMAINIMEKGTNVLLEKPPAVTIQDVDDIIDASKKTGKLCAVDFGMMPAKAFLNLKKTIHDGGLGEIKTITGIGLWKRLDSYYTRNSWAGKLVYNNQYVLDGTVNNPLSHLLNIMLMLAQSAKAFPIKAVTAELYHGHDLESEDTSCVRIETDSGTELLFYATLCYTENAMPYITVEGSKGKAIINYANELKIYQNGSSHEERFAHENNLEKMHTNLINVTLGVEDKLYCSIEDTRNFMLASNGAFESSKQIHSIPANYIDRYQQEKSYETDIKDIDKIIEKCEKEKKLFSEMGVDWAIQGKRFDMRDYKEFNMFIA